MVMFYTMGAVVVALFVLSGCVDRSGPLWYVV